MLQIVDVLQVPIEGKHVVEYLNYVVKSAFIDTSAPVFKREGLSRISSLALWGLAASLIVYFGTRFWFVR